jgi:hypothetical protein
MRNGILLQALLSSMLLSGCFKEAPLPSCVDEACPGEMPVCIDDRCFHHTIEYAAPVCAPVDMLPSEAGCCDLTGGAPAADEDCVLWSSRYEGYALSPVVLAPDGGYLLGSLHGDSWLDLIYISEVGGRNVFLEAGMPAPPGLQAPPTPAAAGNRVAVAAGEWLAVYILGESLTSVDYGNSGSEGWDFARDLGSEVRGLPALCSDGLAAVLTTEGLHVVREGGQALFVSLNPCGLSPLLGPVIDSAAEVVVVPDEDGTAVRAFSYGKGTLEPLWILEAGLLPGGLSGLALDGEGILYAVSHGGQLIATDVTEGPWNEQRYWPLKKTIDLFDGVPVVRTPGEVLLASAQGGFYIVTEEKRFAPDYTAGPPPLAFVVPLRLGGAAGIATVDGDPEVTFFAAGASLPGQGLSSEPVVIGWGGCANSSMTPPAADGTFAFVCDDRVSIGIAPDYTPVEVPWPSGRGPHHSGCL